MRILANENIPSQVIAALRMGGHDVEWVRELEPGMSDGAVLRHAQLQERIVATFDKDFGALAFRAGLPANSGVILLRLRSDSPTELAFRVSMMLSTPIDWRGQFATVESDRVRLRALPRNPAGR